MADDARSEPDIPPVPQKLSEILRYGNVVGSIRVQQARQAKPIHSAGVTGASGSDRVLLTPTSATPNIRASQATYPRSTVQPSFREQGSLSQFIGATYKGKEAEYILRHLSVDARTLTVTLERSKDSEDWLATLTGYHIDAEESKKHDRIVQIVRTCRKKHPNDLLTKFAMAEMLIPFAELDSYRGSGQARAYDAVGLILLETIRPREDFQIKYSFDTSAGAVRYDLSEFDLPWGYFDDYKCGFGLALLNHCRDHTERPYIKLSDDDEDDLEETVHGEDWNRAEEMRRVELEAEEKVKREAREADEARLI